MWRICWDKRRQGERERMENLGICLGRNKKRLLLLQEMLRDWQLRLEFINRMLRDLRMEE
jgi:hypothetical protein